MDNTALRIATYNIKGLQRDSTAVQVTLEETRADIIAIQEPPRGNHGKKRLHACAQAAGYHVIVPGGYPRGGVTTALLATPQAAQRVHAYGSATLPLNVRNWTPQWRTRLTWPSRRGYSYARIDNILVVNIHLGLSALERADHLTRILRHMLTGDAHNYVIAGDLNERPDGPSWTTLHNLSPHNEKPHPLMPATYPAHKPRHRIDTIFTGSELHIHDMHVHDTPTARAASDHLPVIATIQPTPTI
ncbi:endonuclease/exonuclease/phosphatase family protein [Timonella sp. A28]|uniref:endonuclease/exonuclease/phosphatase family protein n=1 Tax=Timonella sp. A28 TaxID=3442640 RepID=UPI003EB6D5E9